MQPIMFKRIFLIIIIRYFYIVHILRFIYSVPGLWTLISPGSDLRLEWGLNQSCSSPRELSNAPSHSFCKRREEVDSRLSVTWATDVQMAHARPFWTSTLQDLSNGIKNTSRRGVLPSAVELWSCGSPGGLQVPTFGSVSLILTLCPKWGCDIGDPILLFPTLDPTWTSILRCYRPHQIRDEGWESGWKIAQLFRHYLTDNYNINIVNAQNSRFFITIIHEIEMKVFKKFKKQGEIQNTNEFDGISHLIAVNIFLLFFKKSHPLMTKL
jgi:hypothetical protein